MKRKAQQEMVGFVLIVTIVVIAMMVLLFIFLRKGEGSDDSIEVERMLQSISMMTTECAPVAVPNYNDFEDLFKTCYNGGRCKNLNKDACEYLNETLSDVLREITKTDAMIVSYSLVFSSEEKGKILEIKEGNCTGSLLGAMKTITRNSQTLRVNLRICKTYD
jgi:hypothetical protein